MPSTTLKHLPSESVTQLAHLLQILPHEIDPSGGNSYSDRLTHTLRKLPSDLKHRSRLSSLLSTRPASPTSSEPHLCLLHKPLSATLIHEVFTLLALEVGAHCNSLIAHNTWLSPQQHTSLQRLRELHSLWLPEDVYRSTFLTASKAKWPHQRSGCEGCMLTRIGSDLEVVSKLAMLLMSRRRTVKARKGHPKLLGFVEGWIDGLVGGKSGGGMGREVLKGSEMEGEELKIIRKRIWRVRRDKAKEAKMKEKGGRGELKEMSKEKEEEEMAKDDGYNSDFENEIVDHYAALRSTLCVPDGTVKASPAKTPSLTTGSSAQTNSTLVEFDEVPMPEPLRPNKSHFPQASSMYSVNKGRVQTEYEPPRRGPAWQARQSAGSQAEEYRNLLTPPLEVPTPRSNPFEEPTRHEVSQYRIPVTDPHEALSRSKSVKQTREYGTSEHRPDVEASPIYKSKTVQEGKKRQTRWSEFSPSGDDHAKGSPDNEGRPRFAFVVNLKHMLALARRQIQRRTRIPYQGLRKTPWYFLSRTASIIWSSPPFGTSN